MTIQGADLTEGSTRSAQPGTESSRRQRAIRGKSVWGVAALGSLLLLGGLIALLPERILFSYRLHFSILELDRDRPLRAFNHRTADGLSLRSWYVMPRDGLPTIVYFAGRDGDIIHKPAHFVEAVEAGHGLLLVGYRGYGGNPGAPQETRMHRDVLALLDQAAQAGITRNGSILYGYSMGSAFAAHAAAYSAPLGVVLEAPISTFLAAVRLQAGRIPGFLVRTRFDNLARMREISAPVLLLAGEQDPVTPPSFAYALARSNPQFASVEVVAGANHFNIMRLGGQRHVDDFLSILANDRVNGPAAAQAAIGLPAPFEG
ncbi:hypothetical protein GRZ55_13175 [Chelativorans sp. ZYF759]|uniref:alpha/beta hydrolase n=1 Tax=Chelativorans sp. ZYF759 TaxID=2692213 RepID=UPI00145C9635|nr:alpha/beta hydrolase [Chelativorans sp. ZYF759]NMG40195.1 hypothetical protein [Chelativorans sp. ZYF759]